MSKRPHEDAAGGGSDVMPLIILKRLEPDHNHMAFTSFNLVADLMFGHYLKNTQTLVAFAIPACRSKRWGRSIPHGTTRWI